ncbi:RICIN domain-containing protein [Streptomyces sp. NPDC059928]|uniref:RICIN domain-containing protein n=1 Tax=unclassified Streptomyces TaxID=2593676 RepID=UPI003659C982
MRPVAGVAVLSLGLGFLAVPTAAADSGGHDFGPADASWAPSPVKTPTGNEKALQAARAQAKNSGTPVVVDYMTTASSQTVANPDGTLTTDNSSAPQRVRRTDGSWQNVDPTLHANTDGTITPVAVPSSLQFSGGGDAPMATMTTADGKKLAIKAPFPLPKPVLDGDSALYKGVLPDVDLELTATALGGWRQVLIVRTAQAAANPAVKKLHLDVVADGLTVTADAVGNLKAADADGKARFTAPSPVMWDSATTAAPSAQPKQQKAFSSLAAQASPTDVPVIGTSSTDGPGASATVTKVAATTTAQGIDLVPDSKVLGQGQGPWFIDPGWNPPSTDSNGVQAWAQVQEAYPDTNEYNGTQYGQDTPATGYCGYVDTEHPCSPEGRTRAYFQVGIGGFLHNQGAYIIEARLKASVIAASSPSTKTPMSLYNTGTISNPTSWNQQPCGTSSVMAGCKNIGTVWMSGSGDIDYGVRDTIRSAVANAWPNFTFGFAPDDEYNKYYRQRFSSKAGQSPHLVITYDIKPTVSNPRTGPTPGFASTGSYSACNSSWDNAGWIGANTDTMLTIGTNSPTGATLSTKFKLWDNDNGNSTTNFATGWASGGDATVSAGALVDGHRYGWQALTTDDTLTSDVSGACYFLVDRTPPTAAVTSTDFPASGTLNAQPKYAGQPGVFTLTGTDPVPVSGGRSSGLACARWTTDPVKAAATGWKCTDTTAGIVKLSGGKADVTITPPHWGTNFVYLQTQDDAGNMSQPAVYSYYAPVNPNDPVKPVFGDVNGDKVPDVLLPDSAGDLRRIGGGTDPNTAPNAPFKTADDTDPRAGFHASPNGNGWKNTQTTHRGSLGYKTVDDLIAHQPGDAKLYLYANDGVGGGHFDSQAKIAMTKPNSCALATAPATTVACADYGYSSDWSKVTQIAAFGSLAGDSARQLPGTNQYTLNQTTLLFVENGRLWLGPPGSINQVDSPAILLSGNDQQWDNYDLITPGRAKGTDLPTLWARSKSDGTIRAFPVKGTIDAPDLSGFTTPGQGPVLGTIDPARYPRIGSDGDLTGDGIPDLWAVDTNQQLVSWNGTGTAPTTQIPHPDVTGLSPDLTPQGNLNRPTAAWNLTGPAADGTAPSNTGNYPGTAANITWPTGIIDGRRTDYAAFNGPQSTITTSASVVDTRNSFTISTWAKASGAGGVIVSQDNTAAQQSDFLLYPDPDGSTWRFALTNQSKTTSSWQYDNTDTVNAQARINPNVWTRLTAVYNADTSRMSLYANGVLVGSGSHSKANSPAPTGPLVFGRYQTKGAPNPMSTGLYGGVSNLAVYPYAASITAPDARGPVTVTSSAPTCIDTDGGQNTDGTKIQIYTCNQTAAQQLELRDDGTLRVQGKCVETVNSGTANGTLIQLMTCKGTTNQQWQSRADGSYLNVNAQRCIDRNNNTLANKTQLQLWDCKGIDSQTWTTPSLGTAAPPTPAPLPDNNKAPTLPDSGLLHNVNSRSCLEINNSSKDDGAAAQQWACNGQVGAIWQFHPTATAGVYEIVNANSGKCLEISNSNTANGAHAQQWTCVHNAAQQWTIQPIDNTGNWNITNLNSGKTLEIDSSSKSDGAPAQQWTHTTDPNQPNQSWYL